MNTTGNVILTSNQIEQKIKRIAYQIYETNNDETEVVIAGISVNGYILAKKIAQVVTEISPICVTLCEVFIDKKEPISKITTSLVLS